MRWCALCGEELRFDSAQGWVHQDEQEGDDRCYFPTSTGHDWKAAERREEAEAKAALPMFEMRYGPARIIWHYAKQVQPTAPPAGE